jgi:hypothetical protein
VLWTTESQRDAADYICDFDEFDDAVERSSYAVKWVRADQYVTRIG